MADPSGIATAVSVGGAFVPASRTPPVLTIQVKPEAVKTIISSLGDLKGRTDDSEITQKGSAYTFTDKRTGLPLAELDTNSGTLAMYKSPKDMAARIDSILISEKTITNFIAESKAEAIPKNNQPSLAVLAAARGQ